MTLAEQLAWLQANTHTLHIDVNDHRSVYETATSAAARSDHFPTSAIRDEAVKRDRIVSVQCYPDTPLGFYRVEHYDLEAAVGAVYELVLHERTEAAQRQSKEQEGR